MNRRILHGCLAACAVLGWAASATRAAEADYPSRPVRMIVPFAPGGASDFVARVLQPKLSEALGQQIVVDNRTGASGNIGVELAARSPADGYTIFLGNVGTMAINPAMFPKFQIRPQRDFIAVTSLVDVPGALAIHPSLPGTTLKEFVDYAKTRPGQLNFGSSGQGSAQGLAMEFVMLKTGIKLQQIPYKGGAGAATTALLAGEVSAALVSVVAFVPFVKSGKIKVIAVVAPQRVPQLPEVQTMVEAGIPELVSGSWQGMYVPAGTASAIVNRLNAALAKTLNDPSTVKRLDLGGAQVMVSQSPEAFAAFMKTQGAFWGGLVRQLGVTEE